MPAVPRYTVVANVSLPSFTITELIACSVVVYRLTCFMASSRVTSPRSNASATALGQHSLIIARSRKGTFESMPRSTPLYLTKRGPVYSRAPIASTRVRIGWPSFASVAFFSSIFASIVAIGIGERMLAPDALS